MTRILLLFLLPISFAGCNILQKSRIRTDGVYRQIQTWNPERHYLRFYQDSTVIGCITFGELQDVKKWFDKSEKTIGIARGKFTQREKFVEFTLVDSLDRNNTVNYSAFLVNRRKLFVTLHNPRINGRNTLLLKFYKIKDWK